MAIITEEPEPPKTLRRKSKPKLKPEPDSPPSQVNPPSESTAPESVSTAGNPFHFWFWFTFSVSLITLFCVIISSLSPQDPKTWFLSLPPDLRHHYSSGRRIKVQTAPNYPQVEVFSVHQKPVVSDSHVLIVHGIGSSSYAFRNVVNLLGSKSVHAMALDLPGSGFSDRWISVVEESEGRNGAFGRMWEVYEEIKEKGLFWGFDQLIEQGYVNFQENRVYVSKKEIIKAVELGSEEMGRVLGQVVDSMGLAPVDLVLHDSALGLSANWISKNRGLIRSVTILDGLPSGAAFPLWTLEMPVVSQILLGFGFMLERVLALCCMKSVGAKEVEAHRILLKGMDGGRAVVGMGKKLNFSFDLSEWNNLDEVKDLPIRVIWSSGWSDAWTSKGRQIADSIPQATLVTHSGGRWTQEHSAEEIAERIHDFVSSLPKSTKQVVEEIIPEDSQRTFNEAKCNNHLHHHGHAGYIDDVYSPEHAWSP